MWALTEAHGAYVGPQRHRGHMWALTEAQGAQLETFHNTRFWAGPSTAELMATTGQNSMADLLRRQSQVAGSRSP